MADELLTPRQVADALGVTPRTVQRWIAQGRLPATRVGGRERVSRSSLEQVTGATATAGGRAPGARPIHSLLIANRGEIVTRIARTARRLGIRTIGLRASEDRAPDGPDETRDIDSYLDGGGIVRAAIAAGVDAIHPGYGFLAENAAFARSVIDAGLTWVGPPPEAMQAMGDKASARRRAAELGVPTLPGYDGEAQDDSALASEAERIGYPLLVKPSAGGGGKGMRVVRDATSLREALAVARRESRRAFGDDRLILERFLVRARHVEIQVLFDQSGHGVHLGERDCSTQRRNQKIVEESPGPSVSRGLREQMGEAALRLASGIGYAGAGTVEFLLADGGEFFFLEMNTRLQVEHPVTEAVTGRDLVEDQLRIASVEPLDLDQEQVRLAGHAVEVRLYAEDAEAGFLPATGPILRLAWPSGPGVRVDAGVRDGDRVSDRYDPMLAKIVCHGRDRPEAMLRLRRALEETMILGVRTNLRFLRWLLDQPVLRDGEMRTDTLADLDLQPRAAIPPLAWETAGRMLLGSGAGGMGPWGGGWRSNAAASLRLATGQEERRVEVPADAADDGTASLPHAMDGENAYVLVEGQTVEFRLAAPPSVEEAVRHAATAEDHALLVAPMPGRVIAVRAIEGDRVEAHVALLVIEAMKMEHAVTTPLAGTVTRVLVHEGQQVQRGDLLAEVSA
ncbi:MAG: helix-turn-helix domain-containing protein [Chloroflexota bacterium]|nr:helix-turn-helix domain-containing protein [Chloroflexota bacterium]